MALASPDGTEGSERSRGLAAAALLPAVFVVVALALKVTTFGDPDRTADETFYFLVGQRMHDGLLPYVDVWDRKPLGLFLIYYLIAGISKSVVSYQVVACLFAAATAAVVSRMVARWAGLQGGLFAGLGYLLAIGPFEGSTGQTPDFYNFFVALAALCVVCELDALRQGRVRWRVWAAMALCGLAITVKQTALFESLFLGLCVAVTLARSGVPRRRVAGVAAAACLIGALPTLLIAGYYWQAGHWPEFWHAMVTSNLAKRPVSDHAWRSLGLGLRGAVLLGLAAWGLLSDRVERGARTFVALWLAAALVGFLSVPNFYVHYVLPLVVPLSVAAGFVLGRHPLRRVLFLALALYSLLWAWPLQTAETRKSIAAMDAMARLIRAHDPGGGLLVFDGPHYLYALTGERFLSPLVFPHHLNHQIENNVSHLDTHAEIDRVIRGRPGVIVMARYASNSPVNAYTRGRVLAYARANCRVVGVVIVEAEPFRVPMVVFGDCGLSPPRLTASR